MSLFLKKPSECFSKTAKGPFPETDTASRRARHDVEFKK